MIGRTISHYRILRKLGEGGMGAVYEAEDTNLQRTVALKFLLPHFVEGHADRERFVQEARAAAALDHANICTIHEIGEVDDQMYIVMAYIEGRSVREIVDTRRLALEEAMDIAIQVANGLREAHEKGFVHRDIKSANVMVTQKGHAKILDFGLASRIERGQPGTEELTAGTAAYMSPEQLGSGRPIDQRSDIWSLGIVLYEMITGELPFKGEYEQAIGYSILNEEPTPLARYHAGIPDRLQAVITRALAKNPDDRYRNVDEMLGDLLAVRGELARSRSRRTYFAPVLRWVGGTVLAITVTLSLVDYLSKAREATTLESIAVLPFENIRNDENLKWLSNALAEKLTFELSKLSSIQVVDRLQLGKVLQESREQRADATVDLVNAVGTGKLGATLALAGSFTVYGDSIQFTTRLVELKSGVVKPLVQEQYSLANLRTLQNDVSRKIIAEVVRYTSRTVQ